MSIQTYNIHIYIVDQDSNRILAIFNLCSKSYNGSQTYTCSIYFSVSTGELPTFMNTDNHISV